MEQQKAGPANTDVLSLGNSCKRVTESQDRSCTMEKPNNSASLERPKNWSSWTDDERRSYSVFKRRDEYSHCDDAKRDKLHHEIAAAKYDPEVKRRREERLKKRATYARDHRRQQRRLVQDAKDSRSSTSANGVQIEDDQSLHLQSDSSRSDAPCGEKTEHVAAYLSDQELDELSKWIAEHEGAMQEILREYDVEGLESGVTQDQGRRQTFAKQWSNEISSSCFEDGLDELGEIYARNEEVMDKVFSRSEYHEIMESAVHGH